MEELGYRVEYEGQEIVADAAVVLRSRGAVEAQGEERSAVELTH